MTILAGLKSYLDAEGNVTALTSTRIHTTQARQAGALPYVVYFIITEDHEHHMLAAVGMARCVLQFDCIGKTPLSAWNVSDQLRESLDGFRGTMGATTVLRSHIRSRNGPELFGPTDGSQIGKYRVRLDVEIDYTESIPTF